MTMSMSTQFWHLAHDDTTGRSRLTEPHLRVGLAAALLCDLALARYINVTDSAIHPSTTDSPDDPLLHGVMTHLVRERAHGHVPRVWLEWFGRNSIRNVGDDMVRNNLLTVDKRRSLFGRTTTTYLPVNPLAAAGTRAQLIRLLSRHDDLDPYWGTLAALAWASGLSGEMLERAPHGSDTHLRFMVRTAPPTSCRELAYTVERLIGDRVLSGQ